MAKNEALHKAKNAKKDEFYTQLNDVQNELVHYRGFFEGKTVFCNCDDPYESNFIKYFALNFNALGIKKLIGTCYAGSPVAGKELRYSVDANGQLSFKDELEEKPRAYKVEINELRDFNGDGREDLIDVKEILRKGGSANKIELLKGDGDFRSQECVELLKDADVVVTNPPFSLFREYVAQLVEYKKKFLIIGNQNAITYKEIFPLLMRNEMWLGYKTGDMAFTVPSSYEPRETRYWQDDSGQKWRSMGNICWFTNIDHNKRHEQLFLVREYTPEKYPKYDNYDAIEVKYTVDIPKDYDGVMGVPITFMDKYCPEQFELLGLTTGRKEFSEDSYPTIRYINAVQHNPNGTTANGSKANTRATIRNDNPEGIYYTADNCNYKLEIVYARILIRRKDI